MAVVEVFNENTGGFNDIIYYDKDEIDAAFSSIDFNVNETDDTYSTEVKISDYIGKLFIYYEGIQTTWNDAHANINSYTEEGESIPEADIPEGLNDFSDVNQEEDVAVNNTLEDQEQREASFQRNQEKEGRILEEQRARDEEAYAAKEALEDQEQREASFQRNQEKEGRILEEQRARDEEAYAAKKALEEKKQQEQPETPKQSETPEQPEVSKESETPEQPEVSKESETPEQPEVPKESETPEQPEVQDQKEEYYRVNTPQGGNLNLRGGPNTKSGIYTSIPNNTELKVKGYEGNWAKVEYKDANGNIQEGYVYKEYISNSSSGNMASNSTIGTGNSSSGLTSGSSTSINTTGTGSQSLGSYTVNTQGGNLNFRSGPGTNSGVYTSIPNQTELNVTGWSEDGKWAHVTYQVGDTIKDGYVWGGYLK